MEQEPTLQIPLNKTTPMLCEECGHDTFEQSFYLRKVSKFIAATPEDAIRPIPTFICSKCKHANAEFKLHIEEPQA